MNDLLGDHEAETDPLVVQLGRSEQLAELAAELGNLVFVDAAATIADLYFEQSESFVKTRQYTYIASSGELDCILHKVYQDLLQAKLISFELAR